MLGVNNKFGAKRLSGLAGDMSPIKVRILLKRTCYNLWLLTSVGFREALISLQSQRPGNNALRVGGGEGGRGLVYAGKFGTLPAG